MKSKGEMKFGRNFYLTLENYLFQLGVKIINVL